MLIGKFKEFIVEVKIRMKDSIPQICISLPPFVHVLLIVPKLERILYKFLSFTVC